MIESNPKEKALKDAKEIAYEDGYSRSKYNPVPSNVLLVNNNWTEEEKREYMEEYKKRYYEYYVDGDIDWWTMDEYSEEDGMITFQTEKKGKTDENGIYHPRTRIKPISFSSYEGVSIESLLKK
jgi:hypothetical protein